MRKAWCSARLLLLFCASLSVTDAPAQTHRADSLKQLLSKEQNPFARFVINKQLADELITKGYPELVPDCIQRMFGLAAELHNDSLLMISHMTTARHLDWKTDSKEEIEYALKALAIAEKKYPSALPSVYSTMASANNDLRNFGKALEYEQKALLLMNTRGYGTPQLKSDICWQLAYAYNYLNKPDSVLYYAQLGSEYYLKHPDNANAVMLKFFSAVTANAYARLGNNRLAEGFYQNSIDADTSSRSSADAWALGQYSSYLLKSNRLQEAKHYGMLGLSAAIAAKSKTPLLQNVAALREIYESAHQPDSAYYFSRLELAYRDSLFNQERLNAVQDLLFKEQVRQQEEEIKQAEDDEQRKHNLQYISITLALVTFLIFYFMLSYSIIANQGLIKFLGVLALLIVFEFMNLLLHPYIANLTHHSPVMMLGIMVGVAALLIPLHHKLEHWVTHKLVAKNNRIKLAAAKKTIARLEGNVNDVSRKQSMNSQR